MNSLIKYFDLASQSSDAADLSIPTVSQKKYHWVPQYIALIAGIFVQPYLQNFIANGVWNFNGLSGWLLFTPIVGLIAFPAVYRGAFDSSKPIFVQLCVIFTAGTGWQTLIRTAMEALAQGAPT